MKKTTFNLTNLLCITLMLFAITITGCGKTENEEYYESLEQELISSGVNEDDADTFVSTLKELENEPIIEEHSTEAAINDFNSLSFEPMEEIKNASLYECKIQIADLLVTPTTIIGDFFSQVENSSVEWEYEYNPEQLVPKHESIDMSLLYNGEKIISFYAYNIAEDTLTLKECLLYHLKVDHYSAQKNIYYGNGYSINGENVPLYTEFKEDAQKYNRYAGDFEDTKNNGEEIVINFTLHSCDIIVPSLSMKAPSWMNYKFHFNSLDGKCTFVEIADRSFLVQGEPFDETIEKNEFLPIGIATMASVINDDFIGTYIDASGNKLILDEYGRALYNDLPGLLLYWSYEDDVIKLANLQSTRVICTIESCSSDIYELKNAERTSTFDYSPFEEGTYTKTE